MRLESISIKNYRQFEKAEINFDDKVTILAGANNSGKTSLITLIKNIFVNDKAVYNVSDIPAKNINEWINKIYPYFQKFFLDGNEINEIEKIIDVIIPKDDNAYDNLLKATSMKIHVSYDPLLDDISLFSEYIMDLDEKMHDFYFLYRFEIVRVNFLSEIKNNYFKLQRRFEEIKFAKINLTCKSAELEKNNVDVKERYLKQFIVNLYVKSMIPSVYYCDKKYKNSIKIDEIKKFRNLFNFCFIKASRPLDDEDSDHSHMLSKQMIKMAKSNENWNDLLADLPDQILQPIQNQEIDKKVRAASLNFLQSTMDDMAKTNGGKKNELMLDMQITEDDISDLLQKDYNCNL